MNQAPSQVQPVDSEPASRVLPVDIEHGGIRLALPGLALVTFIILYAAINALANALAPEGAGGCLAFAGAVAGALLISLRVDPLLKRIWPSGRTLEIAPDGLTLRDRRKGRMPEARIAWEQRVNVLAWRFTVKRGSARIPKGWIMLGCQLVQDETQMTIYTFAPAKEAEKERFAGFTQLVFREVLNKGQMPLREANQQRRLLRAEDERWRDGAELRHEDFALFVDTLLNHVPSWNMQAGG